MARKSVLKKELSLLNVYAIATGATLSSGFFLLPGLAAAQAGPAVILSYLIAAIPLVPALLSNAELSTAMPRAGGVYYFLDRSMGPLFGTVGGIGSWLGLILKTAFALVGMGAYVNFFAPELPMVPLAAGLAVLFGILNLFGAKKTGSFQVYLVLGLLLILAWFSGLGLFQVKAAHFAGFFDKGFDAIFSTAGLVYVSYVGVSNVASISEEVKNPERNLPLGMFLALGSSIIIYGIGTYVMVGVLPATELHGNLTPVADTAALLFGEWGGYVLTFAAILSFFSVANAGIMSASRYPLAMGRDHLMPGIFRRLTKHATPQYAIAATVGIIVLCVVLIDPTGIAKLASAFQLLLFALNSAALIVMRESQIESYDPGFRSPFYPWMQLFGIFAPIMLIGVMGWLPILFTIGLVALGMAWFFYYGKERVIREGAVYHVFARLGEKRFDPLDSELRGILKEKGLREEDPFEVIVARAAHLDIHDRVTFEEVVRQASSILAKRLHAPAELLVEKFLEGTRIGATPVSHGAALPHLRFPDIKRPEMVLVRSKLGITVELENPLAVAETMDSPIFAFFFVISSAENPGQHLRILAQIAGHVDEDAFLERWLGAKDDQELRGILLRDERLLHLSLKENSKSAYFIGKKVFELGMPEGSLIAVIHRQDDVLIPKGKTELREGDYLTIIAGPKEIESLRREYFEGEQVRVE
jgi:amino acid transporter/mannitol/fructose-specific phosphotransferase system IIA component (Ntr-type)